jgi:hypothetical protein
MLGGIRGFVPWSHILKDKDSVLEEKDLQVRVLPVQTYYNSLTNA